MKRYFHKKTRKTTERRRQKITDRVLLMGMSLTSVAIVLQLLENMLSISVEGSEGSNIICTKTTISI